MEINGSSYDALISPHADIDKILGRDVLNQLTVIFKGREGKVIFETIRRFVVGEASEHNQEFQTGETVICGWCEQGNSFPPIVAWTPR